MDLTAGGGAEGGAGNVIRDSSTAQFMKDVIEASKERLILVDFWAPWCGPCKQLTPTLEKVVRGFNGKVHLVKINVDENQAIAAQLRVQSIPTVYAFRDGRPLDGFMGAQSEAQVKAFIDRIIGVDEEADLAEALKIGEQAFEEGDLQTAAEVYASVLEEDAQNELALAGLARCYIQSGDLARADETLALVPPAKQGAAAVASARAALELARMSGSAGDVGALRAAVEANPVDHQARFDLAQALAAANDRQGAVDELLEIVRRDRKWEDDGARKQLVKLFEAWGPKDEATMSGRRRLSSLLFS